ncbi:MAG TPA: DUF488 domain-containing protein [Rhodocyclaceae bacterium]
MIYCKRVYDPADASDGARFLVDRLWPRGVRKEQLPLDDWLKELAPSDDLRHWFGHDPGKWDEFRRRYHAELETHEEALHRLRAAARHGNVTLLFGAHDVDHNNAVALREYLQRSRSGRGRAASRLRARPTH